MKEEFVLNDIQREIRKKPRPRRKKTTTSNNNSNNNHSNNNNNIKDNNNHNNNKNEDDNDDYLCIDDTCEAKYEFEDSESQMHVEAAGDKIDNRFMEIDGDVYFDDEDATRRGGDFHDGKTTTEHPERMKQSSYEKTTTTTKTMTKTTTEEEETVAIGGDVTNPVKQETGKRTRVEKVKLYIELYKGTTVWALDSDVTSGGHL